MCSARRVGLASIAVLVATVLVPLAAGYTIPSSFQYTKEEVRDENYLIGGLTWNSGRGGLSWKLGAPTEDPAGPADDQAADIAQYANYYSRQETNPFPPALEFVSDPLPFPLYLNQSRLIQFDLTILKSSTASAWGIQVCQGTGYGRTSNTNAPEVELVAGEQLVAGAAQPADLYLYSSKKPYSPNYFQDPATHNVCRYRMPTEVGFLPKGTVLTLRVRLTLDSVRVYEYGMAESHQSVLRLPYFPAEEAVFRNPEPTSELFETEAEASGEAAGIARMVPGLAAFGLLATAARSRLRGRVLLLTLLVISAGSAGCFGGASPPDAGTALTGRANSTLEEVADPLLAQRGTGAIVGQVKDDMSLPVSGAHISVLGTANFTSSDGRGRFSLRSLPPAAYMLRIDHRDYTSLETKVTVVANNLTRVDITLIPLNAKEGDARLHTHDYWGPYSQIVAYDDLLGKTIGTYGYGSGPATVFSLQPTEDPISNTIRPGTSEVEVTITWDAQAMGIRRVGLRVADNNQDASFGRLNYTYFMPRSSPATFHVATSWEQTDVGHQRSSTWSFELYAATRDMHNNLLQPEYYTDLARQYASTSPPQFQAKVTIHKGAVPLEPGHPDHWGANLTVPVLDAASYGPYCSNLFVWCGELQGQTLGAQPNSSWVPPRIVPMETRWIEFKVKLPRQMTADPWDLRLAYKGADFPQNSCKVNNPDTPAKSARVVKGAPGATEYEWHIVLDADEADGAYARVSSWCFWLYRPSATYANYLADYVVAYPNCQACQGGQIAVSAIAHRDAPPA